MNKLKLEEEIKDSIYLNGTKDNGKYSLNLEQLEQVGKESFLMMQKVAISFAEHCKSVELLGNHIHSYEECFNDFINNYYE